MNNQDKKTEFDAIVVGSGPAGATIARDLSQRGQRVLVLERGGEGPLREGSNAFVLNRVWASDNLTAVRALTTGGTTAVYFAVADLPPLEPFLALGIDLSKELETAKRELPLAILPDELMGAQAKRLRASAVALGYSWEKSPMLVDISKCPSGYRYEAKWNARTYLHDAVAAGATLVSRARVLKVLVENGEAIGVEYELRIDKKQVEIRKAYGAKVILAAGGAASPIILKNSGLAHVGKDGFYCHPSFAIFATVAGMKTGDNFIGSMGTVLDGDIGVGDGNPARMFYRMFMLANKRWFRAFLHSKSIGLGVMVRDGLGGGLQESGRYHKEISKGDLDKLAVGESVARRILQHAGGKHFFKAPLAAAHIGGAIRIKQHLDENLQTEYRNLHVCDGSIIPENVKATPTLTLICLGKYLANRLVPAA
jgi:hypothetical protein